MNGDFPVLIGRQVGDLRLMDTQVSRRHAQIAFENGAWILRDLGSTNGTFVNGEVVSGMVELEESDQIQIGSFVLLVGPLSLGPKALDDTKMVDAESMDHVLLSPVMPPEAEVSQLHEVSQEDESSHDVMHVEPIAHEDRPEQPEDAEGEAAMSDLSDAASESSIFDQIAIEPPPPEVEPPPLPESPPEIPPNVDDRSEEAAAEIPESSPELPLNVEMYPRIEPSAHEAPLSEEAEEAAPPSPAEAEAEVEPEPVSQAASQEAQEAQELQELPANILDSVMEGSFEDFDDEDHVDAGRKQADRLVSASTDPSHPAWQDDMPKLPRDVVKSPKSRLLWPLSVAVVLLGLAGGGTGYWLIAGRSSPESSRAAPQAPADPLASAQLAAPAPASASSSTPKPAQPDASKPAPKVPPAAVTEAPKPPTSDAAPVKAAAAIHPGAALLTSVLEDGPQLMGETVLRQRVRDASSQPPAPAPAPPPEGSAPAIGDQPPATTSPADSPAVPAPAPAAALPVTAANAQQVEPSTVSESAMTEQPASSSQPAVEAQTSQLSPAAPAALQLDQANVAYLIDASGSLVDTLPELLHWLDEQLQQIDSDLHYTVIFFRGGEAVEASPAGLKDADDRTLRRQVRRWIDWDSGNIIPAGRSDPRTAIDLALRYRVGRIYLLSDGHMGDRLSDEQVADYLVRLEQQVGQEKLVINNVQFFYPEVEGLLAHLVRRYPGERIFIEPPRQQDDQGSLLDQ
ncbi:MAG: FHA domain-containing protein [Phycisphaeraceae bacterium]|nr:FHA domain-containing protein [Phycisphaeraceae bacterium]